MAPLTSMIRIHNLKDNMKLVGSYDFPQDSPLRRYQPQPQSSAMIRLTHLLLSFTESTGWTFLVPVSRPTHLRNCFASFCHKSHEVHLKKFEKYPCTELQLNSLGLKDEGLHMPATLRISSF